MRATHYPSEKWPRVAEKPAEWLFHIFDALDFVGSFLRPSRKGRRSR